MGRTVSGYDPRIWMMHYTQGLNELLRERKERVDNKKKMSSAYWNQRFQIAVDILRHTDPDGWKAWYDDDHNVPDISHREMVPFIEQRIAFLTGSPIPLPKASTRRGIFIWTDQDGAFVFSKEVGKPQLYWLEFDNLSAAHQFIDGLDIKNMGYGVVLDLLPVNISHVSTVTTNDSITTA